MPWSSGVPSRQMNAILSANGLVERNTADCILSRLTSNSLVLLLLSSREAVWCLKSYTMGTTVKSKRKRIPLLYFRNDLQVFHSISISCSSLFHPTTSCSISTISYIKLYSVRVGYFVHSTVWDWFPGDFIWNIRSSDLNIGLTGNVFQYDLRSWSVKRITSESCRKARVPNAFPLMDASFSENPCDIFCWTC